LSSRGEEDDNENNTAWFCCRRRCRWSAIDVVGNSTIENASTVFVATLKNRRTTTSNDVQNINTALWILCLLMDDDDDYKVLSHQIMPRQNKLPTTLIFRVCLNHSCTKQEINTLG
jgi:hypothetical protein